MTETSVPHPHLHPEAVATYKNEPVLRAFSQTEWFTPDYITMTRQTEPYPERHGLEEFKDKLLGDFFLAALDLGKDNDLFLGSQMYITQRTLTADGHFVPLHAMEDLLDEEIVQLSKILELSDSHMIDRGMMGDIQLMLQSIIAPEVIRPKVVTITCNWDEQAERRRKDVLLLSQLVRKGVSRFLQRPQL